jgi:phosphatidylserine synthase
MSILLKIIGGLLTAFGVLAIILVIVGRPGARLEAAILWLVMALILAAVAKLLDRTAMIGKELDHIQTQVDEIRWEQKRIQGPS